MRCGLVATLAVLSLASAAAAAPQLSIQATSATGSAPLHVTFTASEPAHWDFGDGTTADGATVEHTYAAGRWTAVASAASGTQSVVVTAYGLTLSGPNPVRYGRPSALRGTLVPAERGVGVTVAGPRGNVASTKTRADGSYAVRARIKVPGEYVASSARGSSAPAALRVVPKLVTRLLGSGARGGRYSFDARLVPATAGSLTVRITRGGEEVVSRTYGSRARVKLDTRRLATYRIRIEVVPAEGYAGTARLLRANVVLPRLAFGGRSLAVAQLGSRLRGLHYAAPYGARFDGRMLDAVYAFQKVHGLPRTGVVDARFWRALASAHTPLPRYARPANHLEVNKGRQVLYVVRHSRVALIVPISTAGIAGAYTPVGRFSIYRKVGGFDPSPLGTLYDPMYFTGGYAIHGNPSVPPYPASHGCVRVPMWVAPHLYATVPYGETVYVY